jgi:hypothetical protein
MDNLTLDAQWVGDLYFEIKQRGDGQWEIDKLITSVQYSTERNQEGVIVITNRYQLKNGPFPSIEQIRQQLVDRLKKEEDKEQVFLRYDLQKDFQELGFDNYFEMLRSARWEAGFKLLETDVEICPPRGIKGDMVNFQFVLTKPEPPLPPFIWMVRASLVEHDLVKPMISYQAERGFYRLNGHLPNKEEMIREILAVAKLNPNPYEAVRKRFRIGEQIKPNYRKMNYSQGNLGL